MECFESEGVARLRRWGDSWTKGIEDAVKDPDFFQERQFSPFAKIFILSAFNLFAWLAINHLMERFQLASNWSS